MALEFTDGVPSKEAIWYWTSGHRSAYQATLNDWAARPWRVIFDDVGGLSGRPDVEDERSKKLGRHGENLHPATESGRTITPSGRIQAKVCPGDRAKYLRQAEFALNAAFEERNLEGTMNIWLPDADHYSDPFWAFAGRVLAFDPDDKQDNDQHDVWPFQRGFTLAIRCSDPRIYFSEPISDTDATSVTLTNPGRDINPLVFCDVDGSSDLTIINDDLDRQLKVNTSELAGAKVVSFNFDRRVIWASDTGDTPFVDGDDITNLLLTADSDWWDSGVYGIDRGSNTIRQTGGDNITVSFYPCV